MKMRKKINKLISTLLAVELIFSMCYVPIQANENSSDIVILDDGYEIGDGEVSDWVKFIDYDGQTAVLKTIITSDNHSYIILEKSGQTKYSSGGEINYKKYIFDLLHPQNTVPHASSQPVITPYGSEITGSQYKHVRIADAIVELNTEDMAALGFMGVEAVIELFEKKMNVPTKVMLNIINGAAQLLSDVPDRMVITTVTYEVMIKDHTGKYSYYTHCYHVQYLCYYSDGIIAANDYYQSVGG